MSGTEQDSDSLKKKRGAAKGVVTRLITSGDALMMSQDLQKLQDLAAEFDAAYQRFLDAHQAYHDKLVITTEVESSNNYVKEAKLVFDQYRESMALWVAERDNQETGCLSEMEDPDTKYQDEDSQSPTANSEFQNARDQMIKEYEMKRKMMEQESALAKERLVLEMEFRREQRKQQMDLEQMQQDLTRLDEDIPKNPDRTFVGGGLTHSTPMSTAPRHRQEIRPDVTLDVLSMLETTQKQHQTLVESLQIPKTELSHFDGNPLHYWSFIRRYEYTMEKDTISDAAKLNTLLHCCQGKARELLRCCEVMEPAQGYRMARKLLKERFGDENKISHAWMERICRRPAVTGNTGLQDYADDLRCCKETLEAMGFLHEFETGQNLRTVLEKLPYRHRTRWLGKNLDIRRTRYPKLEDVVQFVENAAREVSDPVFGSLADQVPDRRTSDKKTESKGRQKGSFATQVSQPSTEQAAPAATFQSQTPTPREPCWCCGGQHPIFGCTTFKAMKIKDRMHLVRVKGRCMNCFIPGHMGRDCPRTTVCGIDGCTMKHSRFLHLRFESRNVNQVTSTTPGDPTLQRADGDQERATASCSYAGARHGKIALPIVPVRVRLPGGKTYVDTYALLDPGSTCTFCSDALADRLGAPRRREYLELTTLSGKDRLDTTSVGLQASDLSGLSYINLKKVYTRPTIGVGLASFVSDEDVRRWRHFNGIGIPDINAMEVHLILGNDVPEALMPLEVRMGQPGEPYATRTRFGWAINGPVSHDLHDPPGTSYFVSTASQSNDELQKQVTRFWELEDLGTPGATGPVSTAERRILDGWNRSTELVDGHYVLPIPFKDGCSLPDNRAMAERRLALLGKRLARDEDLRIMYTTQMKGLVANGYAELVPDPEKTSSGRVNYIPHHAVTSSKKPGKVRVVFDCAATYRGVSLNTQVHQGPDLTSGLAGVLLRFRQDHIAFMADVEAMFHQVKVPPTDRDALRFLWWTKDDPSLQPLTYRMKAHLFGGVWSPSAANYALRRCATDNEKDFSTMAVSTVLRNFYVDDCLKSTTNVPTAVDLAQQLRTLLGKGGFRLTKWVSSSRELLNTLPPEEHAVGTKNLDLSQNPLPTERALGVLWRVEEDTMGYDVNPPERPATKRGILSAVSSLYDPLGFVSPFILRAKLVFQEACRLSPGWDEVVPEALLQQWSSWLQDLPRIADFTIPRCFKSDSAETYQLHHFADASTKAYGAVSYMRMVDAEGVAHSHLLVSKAKLAPIRPTTIPRLELTAAVEAVKLDRMLKEELELPLLESVFWTDSTIVLWYLKSEEKRFQTFVANRVARILETSVPSQWNHVGTEENPADDCSRGLSATELCNSRRWLNGPGFLCQDKESWPVSPLERREIPDDAEIKKDAQAYVTEGISTPAVDLLLERFSSWYRLRKAVAYLLRFIKYLKDRRVPGTSATQLLEPADLREAEAAIVRYIQKQQLTKEVLKTNRYDRLKPMMSPEGVLCVGGRLLNADLPADVKHPWIVPGIHHVATLIVNHYHVELGHAGSERVLAELRSRYWIVSGRACVRSVIGRCIPCRRARASAMRQEMADLPSDRVTPGDPPFTKVGVDYFGPFIITRGRTELKRYGCLFTCLATRAIHLEVANSLETDTFLNILQRFIARRGKPQLIRSDNGTNFVGAKAELVAALKEWNQNQIRETLLQKEIKWIFNPPGASHMGGVWERQIRTVRSVLAALLRQQRLDDDTLHTVFCVAENIVNSRPITKMSDDPEDELPLTPNHLLLLRSGPALPPCVTVKQDLYRRRWRQVQYMADMFWCRWTKEYLSQLQICQKWTTPQRNLAVGDLVLVRFENTPRYRWPLGLVTNVYPGRDGRVRSAQVRFNGSLYDRPISKLCLLEAAQG